VPTYDAILFDFDGVLADTEPLHWECWASVLKPLGIHLDWKTYEPNCVGIADRELLEFFASLAPARPSSEAMAQAYDQKTAEYRRISGQRRILLPEICDFINSLTDYKLALVTSSKLADIGPILERAGIAPRFGAVVGADQVLRRKPAPDPYLLAASILQAQSPLVVEDSDAGVASARAAGFDVLRIPHPSMLVETVGTYLKNHRPNFP